MPPDSRPEVVDDYVINALAFATSTAPENQDSKHKSVLAAIANGRRVNNALAALPEDAEAAENVHCDRVVRLLNCISAAFHEHAFGKSKAKAVIFGSLEADSTLAGNWIGHAAKPTYYAYLGSMAELHRIIAWNAVPTPKPWSELIQVADHRRVHRGTSTQDQLEPLLSALKAYRPDLPVVHSFTIGHGIIELGTLNVCDRAVSPELPWRDLNSWIAHVALLYDTHRPRDDGYDSRKQPDRDIQYCSAQRDFYRWDVRDEEGNGVAVTPFYVSNPPGRSTFACFDVLALPKDDSRTDPESLAAMGEAFGSGAVQGFWKESWQPPSSQPTELERLSKLHQNGWVPGLVRPFNLTRIEKESSNTKEPESKTDVDMTAEPQSTTDATKTDGPLDEATVAAAADDVPKVDPAVQAKLDARLKEQADRAIYHPNPDSVGKYPGRVKEVLHLGSIGQPLSQCKTAGELLKVMYDLIEVHSHMCDLGILHRDLSWFNIMCNPKHLIQEHPLLKTDTVLPRPCINKILGEGDPEPRVLLTDLDHAIELDDTAARPAGEQVGTPMFISVEVNNPQSLHYGCTFLSGVQAMLLAAEKDADAFKRAFPDGDGTFMSDFERIMQLELERRRSDEDIEETPLARHDCRHDAESIYWVFLLAFGRARPLEAPRIEEKTGYLDTLCNTLLKGDSSDIRRRDWLSYSGLHAHDLFHPLLKPLEVLFKNMTRYLSVPWFLYCGGTDAQGQPRPNIMKPNHVHVAFRRMALGFMLDPANAAALATVLDTQLPRYTRIFEQQRWYFFRPPTPDSSVAGTVGSDSSPDADVDDSVLARKRKAGATRILPPRKCQRVCERDTPGNNPARRNKKLAPGGDDGAAEDDSRQNAGAAAPPRVKSADNLPVKYVASEHQHSEAALALRLMFWKDRELWFGPGIDPRKPIDGYPPV